MVHLYGVVFTYTYIWIESYVNIFLVCKIGEMRYWPFLHFLCDSGMVCPNNCLSPRSKNTSKGHTWWEGILKGKKTVEQVHLAFRETADLIGKILNSEFLNGQVCRGVRSLGWGFTFLPAPFWGMCPTWLRFLQTGWKHRLVWVNCDSSEMLDENIWWIKQLDSWWLLNELSHSKPMWCWRTWDHVLFWSRRRWVQGP